MAALPQGMAYLLPWPVAGWVLDAAFTSRRHRRLPRLLVSSPPSFPAAVGMIGWEGRRSGLGASSPRNFGGYRTCKVPYVRVGGEMATSGLEVGAGDLSRGLNGPCSGRALRTLLPNTHTHTHTHSDYAGYIWSRDLLNGTVYNEYPWILTTWVHFNNIIYFLRVYRLICFLQFTPWSLWILEY
jgi:hypothetical protein